MLRGEAFTLPCLGGLRRESTPVCPLHKRLGTPFFPVALVLTIPDYAAVVTGRPDKLLIDSQPPSGGPRIDNEGQDGKLIHTPEVIDRGPLSSPH